MIPRPFPINPTSRHCQQGGNHYATHSYANRLTVIGKLIIASSFFLSLAVQAQQCGQTAPLINERLSYMKDVAGYKAENHYL